MTIKVTSAQVRAARGLLNWTVRDLADKSGVHRNTVTKMEADAVVHGPTIAAMIRALEDGGVEFTNGNSPGVKLVLWVSDARISGKSYEFSCRYTGQEFKVLAPKAVLDQFDEGRDPRQPAQGRVKRLAAHIGPRIYAAWQTGRTVRGVLHLDADDFRDEPPSKKPA